MYALEMDSITKKFPGVLALDKVSFKVKKGEIHALCGENGAGKSTLMKVLSGLYPTGTYEGDIKINGEKMVFSQISDAERAGICIIHQELALVKELTIGENIFLGNEQTKWGMIDWEYAFAEAAKWMKAVGLDMAPDVKLSMLGIGEQQLVEIAKALSKKSNILILDEPTAALTESEVETLMNILDKLREQGVSCIYISHKLPEVFRMADRITVIRDGKSIATVNKNEVNEDKIVSLMVGRELTERYPSGNHVPQEVIFEVSNYSVWNKELSLNKVIDEVSFYVRKGEILGIAGLMGAGRTELVMSLFGAYEGRMTGDVKLFGQKISIRNVPDAIKAGMALVTEDRKRLGLILESDVKTNTTLASLQTISKFGIIQDNEEIVSTRKYIKELQTKTSSIETKVGTLSGGNQQKVVLAKWLMSNPKILFLDEPTRGIDVGAKFEIYSLIHQLVRQGTAIVMISSELPEILGMSDRILVMNKGRIAAEFDRESATQENIMMAATGGSSYGIT